MSSRVAQDEQAGGNAEPDPLQDRAQQGFGKVVLDPLTFSTSLEMIKGRHEFPQMAVEYL